MERLQVKTNQPAGVGVDIKTKLSLLADFVLDELNPYNRIRKLVSFNNNIVKCGDIGIQLNPDSQIIVVGAGKAVIPMAKALVEIFGKVAIGIVISHKDLGCLPAIGNIQVQSGGHPNPDKGSIEGAKGIIRLLENTGPKDIVFSLISGGGSAMMELPVEGINLTDYIAVNQLLNRSGMDIESWNSVRKHLSQVKGGKLAQITSRAAIVFNLMVSDVKDDKPDVIASGPFTADPSTFSDAINVLDSLKNKIGKLGGKIPDSIINYLKNHQFSQSHETLKIQPTNVNHIIVASNNTAIEFTKKQLENMEVPKTRIQCMENFSGDVEEATDRIFSILEELIRHDPNETAAVIAGGEATVDVSRYPGFIENQSYGGRMQMMAALMIPKLKDLPVSGLFLATDCRDGIAPPGKPNCAGALIDGNTIETCIQQNINCMNYVRDCNTYELHRLLSSQLKKENCSTNVMDLIVLLYYPQNV